MVSSWTKNNDSERQQDESRDYTYIYIQFFSKIVADTSLIHQASGMGAKSPVQPLAPVICRKMPSEPLTGSPRSVRLCTRIRTERVKNKTTNLFLQPNRNRRRAKDATVAGPLEPELLHRERRGHRWVDERRRHDQAPIRENRRRWHRRHGRVDPAAKPYLAPQVREHDAQRQRVTTCGREQHGRSVST